MSGYAYAEAKNGQLALSRLFPEGPLSAGQPWQALMMSRPDVDVQVVELPALPQAEVEGFLRYRLRSLYPGRPDDTLFDHRLFEHGGKRYAALFITRREVLDAHRRAAEGRPLFLPFTLLEPLLAADNGPGVFFSYWHSSWIDTLVLPAGGEPRSLLLRRTGDLSADLRSLEEALPGNGALGRGLLLAPAAERTLLDGELARETARFRGGAGRVEVLAVEPLLARVGRRGDRLFGEKKRRPGPSRALRLQGLGLLLLLLGALLLKRQVDFGQERLAGLRERVGVMQVQAERVMALEQEVAGLREELERLRGRRAPDPYATLAGLARLLPPAVRIRSFVADGRFFELEAVGADPLNLMERFGAGNGFSEVRLVQIVPVPGTREELFRITGRIDGE